MPLTHTAPYFVLTALFLLLASLIVRRSPFFQQATQQSEQSRFPTLDGLRGFLALGVFFNHTVDLHEYFQTGDVNYPGTTFYAFLGDGAVALFFMITGFLFWSKAIAGGRFSIKKFYWARLRRIYPVYWVSLSLMLLVTFIISGFTFREDGFSVLYKTLVWMTCGVFNLPFTNAVNPINSFPQISGFNLSVINSGVCWTLVYELHFYLVFPLLALLVKPLRFMILFIGTLLLYKFASFIYSPVILCFLFGMLTAYLVHHFPSRRIFRHWSFSAFAVLLLVGVPLALRNTFQPGTFPFLFTLPTFIVFVIIVYENSLFGLLSTPASRHLGKISYDIYLLHGIVLFSVLSLFNRFYPVKSLTPIEYWGLAGISGLIVIAIAGVVHQYIEDPLMRMKTPPPVFAQLSDLFRSKKA